MRPPLYSGQLQCSYNFSYIQDTTSLLGTFFKESNHTAYIKESNLSRVPYRITPVLIGERAKPHTNWSKWKVAIFICYTYVTQNAHALTHAHEIATKQCHNKQSFSLSLKLKHYCSEYYGTQRTRKQAKEVPEHPLETDQQRRARPHERNERDRARRRTESKEQRKTRLAKICDR